MTVLPSQKLSIGELCVSLAVGLMFFLLPNDAKNQFQDELICESFCFVISLIITIVLYIVIKRFEAVGVALLTMSVLIGVSVIFSTFTGMMNKGVDFWPTLTRYRIVSTVILWLAPFIFVVIIRLLSGRTNDNGDVRRSFVRFLSLSLKAMMIVYLITIIFRVVIPVKPDFDGERDLLLIPFSMVERCVTGEQPAGAEYIIWNCLILAPLTFYLSVTVSRVRVWHSLIIAFALGLTLEALEFILNTGPACIDDMFMYLIGALIGILLKEAIDFMRRIITLDQERIILTCDYTPVRRSNGGEAEIIEEE